MHRQTKGRVNSGGPRFIDGPRRTMQLYVYYRMDCLRNFYG
jgi:hypothetical protein